MATALDWEQSEQFKEVLTWANAISLYVKKSSSFLK